MLNIAIEMKYTIFFIGIIMLYLPVTAQSDIGELKFNETIFDFGSISEKSDKKIKHDFIVTNIGKKPITITNIETSCDVISQWTQTPILPNKKGKITIEYAPVLPGAFLKYFQVYTDGKPQQKLLFIQGNVENYPPSNPPKRIK